MIWDPEDKTSLRVLIMEDSPGQRDKYNKDLAKWSWKLTLAYNKEDALEKININNSQNAKFDVLAFDCVINGINNEGIRLAIDVADKDKDQRLLVYTTQVPGGNKIDYSSFAKELVSRRISFIKVAGNENEEALPLELAIWATAKGFLIFSPTPAFYLPSAIARLPDPLEGLDWMILKALHQFPDNRKRAADKVGMTVQNLNTRLRDKIRPQLIPRIFSNEHSDNITQSSSDSPDNYGSRESLDSELAQYERETEKITDEVIRIFVSWYLENRGKYCRE